MSKSGKEKALLDSFRPSAQYGCSNHRMIARLEGRWTLLGEGASEKKTCVENLLE